jgi:hypothetical protein
MSFDEIKDLDDRIHHAAWNELDRRFFEWFRNWETPTWEETDPKV